MAAEQQTSIRSVTTELADIRALRDRGDYRSAAARAQALLDHVESQPSASPLDVATALDSLVESLALSENRRLPQVLLLARRAVDLKEQAVGADDAQTAYSRTNLGIVLTHQADFATAKVTLERALAVQELSLGNNSEITARTLGALGSVYRLTGDLKTARDYFERSLRALESAVGQLDMRVAYTLINLTTVVDGEDSRRAAIAISERAAEIIRKLQGPNHPLLAQVIGNMAYDFDRLGEFSKSDELHRQSIEIFERTTGPDTTDLAWELNNYGLLDWRLGDFAASLPKFQRALDIWTRHESPDASKALNNLAISHRRLGNLVEARRYYERALVIKEKIYGPDHPDVALVLFNTANLLKEMGDLTAARLMYTRALAIRERRLGSQHLLTAYTLNGLGDTLRLQHDYAAAKPLLDRAAAIWREANVPELGIALSSLAEYARDIGNTDAALRLFDEARAVYVKSFGEEYIDVAVVWNNSATLVAEQGAWQDASRRFSRALSIVEKQLGVDHPSIAEIASGLAATYLHLGDPAHALQLALRSERISRTQFELTSQVLSEREALLFSSKRAPALDVLLTLAIDGELSAAEQRSVVDAVIRSRAMVLDEIGQRNRWRGVDQAVTTLMADVGRARQRLSNLLVRGAGAMTAESQQLLQSAQLDVDSAERRLAEAGVEYRERFERSKAGFAEVAAHIPPKAAMIAFVTYDHIRRAPATTAKAASAPQPRYAAVIIRADGSEPSILKVGSVASVDRMVSDWRRELMRAPRVADALTYRRVSTALASTVWLQLAGELPGVERVFVVPDGALNLVSFAALPDAANRFLVDSGPLIHYLSAERDLVNGAAERAPNRGLLVVGNPAYSDSMALRRAGAEQSTVAMSHFRGPLPGCPDFVRVRFEGLAGTLEEVSDITAIWSSAAEASVEQLTDHRATEAAFKKSAPKNRILHLATHGFFLGSCNGGVSTRAIGGLATNSPSRRDLAGPAGNPFVLSGLALAGANQRATAGPDDDDGILTAEEVASLQLDGVEWAVLSACDTGLGTVHAGEGVFGLRRAFVAAGVRTTIMSLWSVDDESTREWMSALYDSRLRRGLSTIEAVQEAGRSVLRSRRARKLNAHPFFWAAFVAAGDWR